MVNHLFQLIVVMFFLGLSIVPTKADIVDDYWEIGTFAKNPIDGKASRFASTVALISKGDWEFPYSGNAGWPDLVYKCQGNEVYLRFKKAIPHMANDTVRIKWYDGIDPDQDGEVISTPVAFSNTSKALFFNSVYVSKYLKEEKHTAFIVELASYNSGTVFIDMVFEGSKLAIQRACK